MAESIQMAERLSGEICGVLYGFLLVIMHVAAIIRVAEILPAEKQPADKARFPTPKVTKKCDIEGEKIKKKRINAF